MLLNFCVANCVLLFGRVLALFFGVYVCSACAMCVCSVVTAALSISLSIAAGVEGAGKERVREPVTAEQGGEREGEGREGGGREGREGEGESETREEREKMATGTAGEGGEGEGSHDKLPGDAMHDQNLSQGSRDPLDKLRDVPPDIVQSGQSVDLQDNTRDEL